MIPDSTTQVQDLAQRQFRLTTPNQLWLADISYIRTWHGWLYLAVIVDALSRKVVGWAVAGESGKNRGRRSTDEPTGSTMAGCSHR